MLSKNLRVSLDFERYFIVMSAQSVVEIPDALKHDAFFIDNFLLREVE